MLQAFNEGQLEAIHGLEGEWIVISCPGSGKTTVIIERAHQMVLAGKNPRKILIVTFTKEAATEMERRYIDTYGADGITFGTIHAICFRVIGEAYGYRRENIITELAKWKYFHEKLLHKEEQNKLDEMIKSVIADISLIKNSEADYQTYKPERCKKDLFQELYEQYEADKRKHRMIDFDDMLLLCREAFRKYPEILDKWQNMYDYIMIDEYQDTNGVQNDIFCMMAARKRNLFVVGDDDQSIYKFRAADSRIMLDFAKKHPASRQVNLSVNYRSEPQIIEAASKLIAQNQIRFPKQFLGHKTGKGEVHYTQYKNLSEQADAILALVEQYHKLGIPYEEMAILFRNNVQNRVPASRTLRTEIPFYTTEPVRDIHTEFIFTDIMAYYRLAEGIGMRGDMMRIINHPSRYLKQDLFRNFVNFEESAMYECAENIIAKRSRENAIDKIGELSVALQRMRGTSPEEFMAYFAGPLFGYKSWLYEYAEWRERDPQEFLDILNLLQEEASHFKSMSEWFRYAEDYAQIIKEQNQKKEHKGICLSTFHSAKGLEWDVVFLIDANEEITPYKKAVKSGDIEEERRLFYVAVTRARKFLHVSYIGIGKNPTNISRFVSEMQGIKPKLRQPVVVSKSDVGKCQLKKPVTGSKTGTSKAYVKRKFKV